MVKTLSRTERIALLIEALSTERHHVRPLLDELREEVAALEGSGSLSDPALRAAIDRTLRTRG